MNKLINMGFVALLFILCLSSMEAQYFHFHSIDSSEFPTMKGTFLARNKAGTNYSDLTKENFKFYENENQITTSLKVECGKNIKYFVPASIAIVWDVSMSFNQTVPGNEKRIDWMKTGVKTMLFDTLKQSPGTSVSIITFASSIAKTTGFLSDWSSLDNWINQNIILTPGATDFKAPFMGYDGAIESLKRMPIEIPRVLLFLTDGEPERYFEQKDVDTIINRLRAAKIRMICINIIENPNFQIDYICQQTGGKVYYDINTKTDLLRTFRIVTGNIQTKDICQLSWQTTAGCDESSRNRNVKVWFNMIPDSTMISYKAPPVPKLDIPSNKTLFGKQGTGHSQKQFTITAQNADWTITSAAFNPSTIAYKINWNGKNLPFTINKGQSHTFLIDYVQEPPGISEEVKLSLQGTPCPIGEITLVGPCLAEITEKLDLGNVMASASFDKTFNCVLKNKTAVQITGNTSLEGADIGEFTVLQGFGSFTLNPEQCLDVKIRFRPVSAGIKNASLKFTLNAECGNYTTNITGVGTPNSVDNENSNNIEFLQTNPNPVSEEAVISFVTSNPSKATIIIYNLLGVEVLRLNPNIVNEGLNKVELNLKSLSLGLYNCVVILGNSRKSIQIIKD